MCPQHLEAEGWPAERTTAVARTICDPGAVGSLLQTGLEATGEAVAEIIFHAGRAKGLACDQVAALLALEQPDLRAQVKTAAAAVHERLYARRVRLSNPVCPTNRCLNDCLYCPLRQSNALLRRNLSTASQLQREVTALIEEGHHHLTLVFGEHPSGVDYVREMVRAAFGVRTGVRQVQRVDLNLNASHPDELQALAADHGVGTYHSYQETYHPGTYALQHPDGPKSDYEWRITSHDRACAAGMSNLGLGALLGLYDYRFDVLALLLHAAYLESAYHPGALTISYPRLTAAPGAPASTDGSWAVSDEEFCFLVAVTRLALPLAEIVLNTPAPPEVRRELYSVGVSQVAVGSLSYPGVYSSDGEIGVTGGLSIGRPRNLETLVYRMCEAGFVPNFCPRSYAHSKQRTNAQARHSELETAHRDAANSLLALQEYLLDEAAPQTLDLGTGIIQDELARLPRRICDSVLAMMDEARAGLHGQRL